MPFAQVSKSSPRNSHYSAQLSQVIIGDNLTSYRAALNAHHKTSFLTRGSDYGLGFLDTSACLCSLLWLKHRVKKSDTASQCIGNQTQGVYRVITGKWFESWHGDREVKPLVYDGSNCPDAR